MLSIVREKILRVIMKNGLMILQSLELFRIRFQISLTHVRGSLASPKISLPKYRSLTFAAPWQLRYLLVSDISHRTHQGAARVNKRYFSQNSPGSRERE